MPLISIIVPCYNQSQYLDECLQSVLHQTFTDWECIIVNDGSPDNTEEVAAKWVEKDARFHYYKKENGGVASARNFGIERAKGEWILPLDGDDKIGNQYLELALKKCNEGYDLVYCHANYFGARNEEFTLPNYSYEVLLKHNIIFCSAIFNKNKIGDLKYDEKLVHGLEDWDFWIGYLSQNNIQVYKLEETLFYYRIKEISRNEIINSNSQKMDDTKMYILQKHRSIFYKEFGDYFSVIWSLGSLEKENAYLKKLMNSKRFQLVNKIITSIQNIVPNKPKNVS